MLIYALDDEPLALAMLEDTIRQAAPNAQLYTFTNAYALLEAAKSHLCDIAFLDIELGSDLDGVALARKLREMKANMNIIFVTAYEAYTREALSLRASGYLMKPVCAEQIKQELQDLRYPVENTHKLQVNCFGNFDVFLSDGTLFKFDRAKSKELFAYLVYKRGTSCTIKELAAVLFENSMYDDKQKSYIQKIISTLMMNLREQHAEHVVQKQYNSIRVNMDTIQCDYYDFLLNRKEARNAYHGEFMKQYSWAEAAVAYMDFIKEDEMSCEAMNDAYTSRRR